MKYDTEQQFDNVCGEFWADYQHELSQYEEVDEQGLLMAMAQDREESTGIPEHMLRLFVMRVQ